jgi:hypothetical protein
LLTAIAAEELVRLRKVGASAVFGSGMPYPDQGQSPNKTLGRPAGRVKASAYHPAYHRRQIPKNMPSACLDDSGHEKLNAGGLTTDMEIWTLADTKLDAGGHETWTLADTKSGHPPIASLTVPRQESWTLSGSNRLDLAGSSR